MRRAGLVIARHVQFSSHVYGQLKRLLCMFREAPNESCYHSASLDLLPLAPAVAQTLDSTVVEVCGEIGFARMTTFNMRPLIALEGLLTWHRARGAVQGNTGQLGGLTVCRQGEC